MPSLRLDKSLAPPESNRTVIVAGCRTGRQLREEQMNKPEFNIAVVQMDCVVGETEPNLNKIRHFTALSASIGADLVIFPECATTGYFIGERISRLAEAPDGPTSKTLGDIAREHK